MYFQLIGTKFGTQVLQTYMNQTELNQAYTRLTISQILRLAIQILQKQNDYPSEFYLSQSVCSGLQTDLCRGLKYLLKLRYIILVYSKVAGPYVPAIFATSRKKVIYPNGPFINTNQTKIRNVCLSVILEFCLFWSVVCIASAAYTSLCRGLKYIY